MTSIHPSGKPRIVVGVDGSPASQQALRWAAGIAATTGAQIEAVTAWQYPPVFSWAIVQSDWNPADDMEKSLVAAVDEVFGTERPADLKLTTREGHPSAVLLDAGTGALMIVVGSRGRGGFAGLLLGSVSAHVAEHAHCPVLVVHGDQPFPRG